MKFTLNSVKVSSVNCKQPMVMKGMHILAFFLVGKTKMGCPFCKKQSVQRGIHSLFLPQQPSAQNTLAMWRKPANICGRLVRMADIVSKSVYYLKELH